MIFDAITYINFIFSHFQEKIQTDTVRAIQYYMISTQFIWPILSPFFMFLRVLSLNLKRSQPNLVHIKSLR